MPPTLFYSDSTFISFFDPFNPEESLQNQDHKRQNQKYFDADDLPKKCPVVSFERAMEINLRSGPQCHPTDPDTYGNRRNECCDAIERARIAADDAERMIEGNWYIRHCSFSPFWLSAPPLHVSSDEDWFLDPIVNAFRQTSRLVFGVMMGKQWDSSESKKKSEDVIQTEAGQLQGIASNKYYW